MAPTYTPPNPVSLEPLNEGHPDPKVDAVNVKENSPTSPFVNSEPIREEKVQNAMKFLLHPKVRGSPVMHRRSFLEGKGLTTEEIDEAFRRVPDTVTAVSTTHPDISSQDEQIKPSSIVQHQPPSQVLQPAAVAPVGSTSKIEMLSPFHWYHAILAVGLLVASGAVAAVFFKKFAVPRLNSWIRKAAAPEEDDEGLSKKNDAKASVAEEAAAVAKSAVVAAADLARASHEMLTTKGEEKRCFEELISMLNAQVHEMKSMSISIQKLESGLSGNGRISLDEQDNRRFLGTCSRLPYTSGNTYTDSRSVRPTYPPVSAEPPQLKSYMEGINDAPPNPNQPIPNPCAAPARPKVWEGSQPQSTSASTHPSQECSDGSTYDFQGNQMKGDDAMPGVESGEQHNFGCSNMPAANDQPPQMCCVPPDQLPTWVMELTHRDCRI